jgi:hypothetical protein
MVRPAHPVYSSNLAPSDFYLSGRVKNRPDEVQASDADTLFEYLHQILLSISVEEFGRVFAAWIDPVRQIREGNGDYITW